MSSTLNSQPPKRTDTRSRNRNNASSTGGNRRPQKTSNGDRNESLVLLCELFPHWAEEDLAAVLGDVGGDLETACNKIADGHATQWTAAGKKVPKPVEKKVPGKKSKDAWGVPTDSFDASSTATAGSLSAPSAWDTQAAPSSWDTQAAPSSWEAQPAASSELSWDLKTEDNITSITEELRTVSIKEVSIQQDTETIAIQETTVVASVVQQVLQESGQKIVFEESVVQQTIELVEEEEEEDFVVRLPSMPARKQAALEIEPSAVLLPFSVPIKSGSNISFGAPGLSSSSKVLFGESKTVAASSVAAPVAPLNASPTTQKVYSPEELFASATRSSGQTYATTSVDAGNPSGSAPPGLGAVPKSPSYLGHQQHHQQQQSYEHQEHGSAQRRHQQQQQQQQMPFYGQRYDSYGSPSQQQQQQHSFAQRFSPYAAQDESFGAVPPTSYYSGARQTQAGAASAAYYHHPHHYAPHVMYGADPYGAAAFNPPPTARYHPGTANNGTNTYASGTAGQQQYQSPGSNSSRSRMF